MWNDFPTLWLPSCLGNWYDGSIVRGLTNKCSRMHSGRVRVFFKFDSGGFMPGIAVSARTGRYATRSGRVATIRRPAEETARHAAGETAAPKLTLTVAIPLTDDTLSPQAHRLIEAVRELVEAGNGAVTLAPDTAASARETPAEASDGTEVRLLSASRQVVIDGRALPLTRLEFDLLQFLADHPRRVFTRAQLLVGVWGYEHTGERTVDVHVRRLRVKLGNQVPLITTVYGVGYRLADDARIIVLPHD
jgi:two-component system OmpR family response regulator